MRADSLSLVFLLAVALVFVALLWWAGRPPD